MPWHADLGRERNARETLTDMNLYKIERTDKWTYDDYDSAVVVAENEEDARTIVPNKLGECSITRIASDGGNYCGWVWDPELVQVTYLGEAATAFQSPQVIVASFNAG
jgi:hypothetical protein